MAASKKHIRAGANEVVGIGHGGCLGAAWVNYHQLAAPGLQGFGLAFEVRHRPHAAIAGQGVGANHQQQVRAADIGQANGEPVAKHQAAGQLLGHLVQRRGRKHILGAQRTRQFAKVREQANFVGGRVTHGDAGGVASALGDDGG